MQGRRVGYSLIELVIVMSMVGLMVAIAIPRIDITGYRANSALQVLGTTILTAQRQALTQQHDIIVRFDTVNLRLRVHQDRNNNTVVDNGEHIRSVPMVESIVFGRGDAPARGSLTLPISFTRMVSGDRAIIFHRDGSASEGGGFYLTSNKAEGPASFPEHTRLVVVERSTGRAASYRYMSGTWRKVF